MGKDLSLLHRLTASNHRLEAAELESEVEKLASCCKLRNVELGAPTTVGGRLRSVRYTPTENVPVLEAEIYDGSAAMQLMWLGRRRIPGIEPGRRLIARGRVGLHNGHKVIYNPWYELQ